MTDPTPTTPATPAADPGGFLVDLLGRYLPPGYIESLIRTWVPIGVGTALTWLLSWVAAHWHWHIVLDQHASATVGMIAVGVITAAYYALARLAEKHWPQVGRVLISLNLVKARPVYAKPTEGVRLINTRTGVIRRGGPTTGL